MKFAFAFALNQNFKRSYSNIFQYVWLGKMSKLHVKCVPSEERINMMLKISRTRVDGAIQEKVVNFNRRTDADLGATLQRICTSLENINSKIKGKAKKMKIADTEDTIKAILYDRNNEKFDDSLLNSEVWADSQDAKLHLNFSDTSETLIVPVQINMPTVNNIKLPAWIISGLPTNLTFQAEFTDMHKTDIIWLRENKEYDEEKSKYYRKQEKIRKRNSDSECDEPMDTCLINSEPIFTVPWIEVGRGLLYTPTDKDVGSKLKCVFVPHDSQGRVGEQVECISKAETQQGFSEEYPFRRRQLHTKEYSPHGSFRVMTYNILADLYANSDFTRQQLHPYCPPEFLSFDYRKEVIKAEIQGYKSDIICLQEVDSKMYKKELSPLLGQSGYSSTYTTKVNATMEDVNEGSAIFVRDAKFRVLAEYNHDLKKAIHEELMFAKIREQLLTKQQYFNKIFTRTTGLQVVVLESLENPKELLCVATTHLYFHPKAPNIRIVQAYMCNKLLENILDKHRVEGQRISLVFTGDFNSTPNRAVHQFMIEKYLPPNHADLYSGGIDEYIPDLDLQHNLNIFSAAGTPAYTNYVGGFDGCLDYIYADQQLNVVQQVPLPTHQEVTAKTALPNALFPSDHIALICDLTWKETDINKST